MNALNMKYKKKWKDFDELKAGIGVAYGRALVIKAGFSGSGIKDLVYRGDVVNKASKMCELACKEYRTHAICVTEEIYVSAGTYIANAEKMKTFQDFLTEKRHNTFGSVYVGNFHRESINNWAEENK